MTEELELEALQYLLGQMDAGSRARFEVRLARDPAVQSALKSCTDSMARFACETAPAEPMSAADQQTTLAAILNVAAPVRPQPTRTWAEVVPWSRYVWPAAAAVLLGLNLVQLSRQYPPAMPAPAERAAGEGLPESVAAEEATSVDRDGTSAERLSESGGAESLAAKPVSETSVVPVGATLGPEQLRRFERLRNDYAELERANAALRAQYEAMAQHLAGRVAIEKTVGRIAAMELVDPASYAAGERKGLLEIARGILVEPGVVVVDTGDTLGADGGQAGGEVGVTIGSDTSGTGAPRSKPEAYAWSVFDDKERRGYLNLYNLPQLPPDQALQLWVKSVDSEEFRQVGEVPPQFYGSNGSVYYTLPNGAAAPAEILITQEIRSATPPGPTGPVVLRGP